MAMEIKERIVKMRYGMEIGYGQEIVRCKNCRWWHESETEEGFGDCGQANGITLKPSNWFCADGERQEGREVE